MFPVSRLGRLSLAGIGIFALGLGGLLIAAASGQRGGDAIYDNWWLAGPATVAAIAAVATFATALTAVIRSRDRSVGVLASLAISAMAVVYMLAEIAFPH